MKKDVQIPDLGWSGSAYAGPSESPGFLFWRNFMDWQRQLNTQLKPLGLTQPQFSILAICGWLSREGKKVSQHDIVVFTGMDRMHISQIVSRLEKDGLVEKEVCSNDRRVNLVCLSAKGRALLEVAIPIVEVFDEKFFHHKTLKPGTGGNIKA